MRHLIREKSGKTNYLNLCLLKVPVSQKVAPNLIYQNQIFTIFLAKNQLSCLFPTFHNAINRKVTKLTWGNMIKLVLRYTQSALYKYRHWHCKGG